MTARLRREEAPPERVKSVDATDWRDDFASEPERSPAERLRLGDSTDELEAFAAAPAVDAAWMDDDVAESRPSRFDWMRRARRAALVCSVLAAAAAGVVVLRMPATPLPAVKPPEPAIMTPAVATPTVATPAVVAPANVTPANDAPAIDVPASGDVERAGGPSLVLADPTPAPAVDDAPSVPRVERRSAPVAAPPAARPAEVEPSAATVGAPAASSAAAPLPTPDVATSASLPPPAVGLSPVVAGASTAASSPAETSTSANVPVQAAAEPSARALETRAVEDVLERYRLAFNRLDAGAALKVWPTVDEKTLARAFERLKYQNVFFSSCQIVLGAMFAEATCIGSTRHEPKVGSRATKPEARRWRFSLRKSSGAWLIDRVDMR